MVRNGSTTHTCIASSFISASMTKPFLLTLKQEMVAVVLMSFKCWQQCKTNDILVLH